MISYEWFIACLCNRSKTESLVPNVFPVNADPDDTASEEVTDEEVADEEVTDEVVADEEVADEVAADDYAYEISAAMTEHRAIAIGFLLSAFTLF